MPVLPTASHPSSDRTPDDAPVLTEEERDAVAQRMAAIDKIFADAGKARYKIELFFTEARNLRGVSLGALSFWESGAKIHGGGDMKIYLCPGSRLRRSSCSAFIPSTANGYGHLVCPSCKTVWTGEEVIGEDIARLTMRDWARKLLEYFIKLEHNADVYVKHAQTDIRTKAYLEQERQKGGDVLSLARTKRVKYVYPLRNILKDTASGADPLGRFYAFLTA